MLEFISNFWGIGLVIILLTLIIMKSLKLRGMALNALEANHQSKLLQIGEQAAEQAKERSTYAEDLEMLKLRYMAGIILFFFIAAVLCLYLWKFNGLAFGDTADVWGQMGDYFGGMLNPIFAFASFMALLYTINIQSKQLDVSTKELEATRKELAEAAKAQNKSSKALESQMHLSMVQNSEGLFYKAHNKLLADIKKVTESKFSIRYYKGDGLHVEEGNETIYYGITKEKDRKTEVNFDVFLDLYKNKGKTFSMPSAGFHYKARFGSGSAAAFGAKIYVIENTSDGIGLIRLFNDNYLIFENVLLSLNYALNAVFDLSDSAKEGKDFSLFYYSYIVEAISDDLLIFLCMIFSKSHLSTHKILSEFKFFERLKIDKDGFIANGLLHVSDFNLPHRSFGNNENFGLFKAAAKSVDVC